MKDNKKYLLSNLISAGRIPKTSDPDLVRQYVQKRAESKEIRTLSFEKVFEKKID